MKVVALEVCKRRPKVKDAVAVIRRYRTGTVSKGSGPGLRKELIRTVSAYLARHPGMSWAEVRWAVRELVEQMAVMDGDGGRGTLPAEPVTECPSLNSVGCR